MQDNQDDAVGNRILAFGPFVYDGENRLLYRHGEELDLAPRAADVLECFLLRPGKVLTKDELLEAAWGDIAVSEHSLTDAIRLLRQALDDSAKEPRYIETLWRRGYRFKETVEEAASVGEADPATFSSPSASRPSPPAVEARDHGIRTRFTWGSAALLMLGAGVVLGALAYGPFFESARGRVATDGVVERRISGVEDPTSRISADGRYLSYYDWDNNAVVLRELRTDQQRLVTDPASWEDWQSYALSTAPSPDASRVAYTWWNGELGRYELRVTDVAAGTTHTIEPVGHGYIEPYGWSADGSRLLAHVTRGDNSRSIEVFSRLGEFWAGSVVLDSNVPVCSFMDLSPDGEWIAYDRPAEVGVDRDIWIASVDGQIHRPLLSTAADEMFPMWLPDGDRLVFVSDRRGGYSLWAVSIQAGQAVEPDLLNPDVAMTQPLGVTADGNVYFARRTGDTTDAYIAELDSDGRVIEETVQRVSEVNAGVVRRPQISPVNSNRIAYIGGGWPTLLLPKILHHHDRRANRYELDLRAHRDAALPAHQDGVVARWPILADPGAGRESGGGHLPIRSRVRRPRRARKDHG